MPDKYSIQARYAPALLCCAPFVAIGFYLLNQIDANFWGSLLSLGIGGVTMTYALFQLAVHACRWAGKYLEERIFEDGRAFPTTTFMLDGDTNCSQERKATVVAKIKAEFKISLKGKTSDSPANRIAIHEAISQIRKKFYKTSEMLLQRNIQFGFARNLAGGSIVAAITSLMSAVVSLVIGATTAFQVLGCLFIGYTVVAIAAFWAIEFTAKHYAHTLFDEFLGT